MPGFSCQSSRAPSRTDYTPAVGRRLQPAALSGHLGLIVPAPTSDSSRRMCLASQVASAFANLLDWPTVNKVVSLPKDLEEGLEPGSARRGAHRCGGQTLARKPWAQFESAWFLVYFSRPSDCFQLLVGLVRSNNILFYRL